MNNSNHWMTNKINKEILMQFIVHHNYKRNKHQHRRRIIRLHQHWDMQIKKIIHLVMIQLTQCKNKIFHYNIDPVYIYSSSPNLAKANGSLNPDADEFVPVFSVDYFIFEITTTTLIVCLFSLFSEKVVHVQNHVVVQLQVQCRQILLIHILIRKHFILFILNIQHHQLFQLLIRPIQLPYIHNTIQHNTRI